MRAGARDPLCYRANFATHPLETHAVPEDSAASAVCYPLLPAARSSGRSGFVSPARVAGVATTEPSAFAEACARGWRVQERPAGLLVDTRGDQPTRACSTGYSTRWWQRTGRGRGALAGRCSGRPCGGHAAGRAGRDRGGDGTMTRRPQMPKVLLTTLSERTSANGNTYLSG